MRKQREALLMAAFAGLVIVSAAAFVVQPGFGRAPSVAGPAGPVLGPGLISAPGA